jgi:hypothetical protein
MWLTLRLAAPPAKACHAVATNRGTTYCSWIHAYTIKITLVVAWHGIITLPVQLSEVMTVKNISKLALVAMWLLLFFYFLLLYPFNKVISMHKRAFARTAWFYLLPSPMHESFKYYNSNLTACPK